MRKLNGHQFWQQVEALAQRNQVNDVSALLATRSECSVADFGQYLRLVILAAGSPRFPLLFKSLRSQKKNYRKALAIPELAYKLLCSNFLTDADMALVTSERYLRQQTDQSNFKKSLWLIVHVHLKLSQWKWALATLYRLKGLDLTHQELLEVEYNLALVHLTNGDVEKGLVFYRCRFDFKKFPSAVPLLPIAMRIYDFNDISEGESLVVFGEQGIGDQLMFLYQLLRLRLPVSRLVVVVGSKLIQFLEDDSRFEFEVTSEHSVLAEIVDCEYKWIAMGDLYWACSQLSDADCVPRMFGRDTNEQGDLVIAFNWRSATRTVERNQQYLSLATLIENFTELRERLKEFGFGVKFLCLQERPSDDEISLLLEFDSGIKFFDCYDDVSRLHQHLSGCDIMLGVGTFVTVAAAFEDVPTYCWRPATSWVSHGRAGENAYLPALYYFDDMGRLIESVLNDLWTRLNEP